MSNDIAAMDPCWGNGQGQGGYGPDTYTSATQDEEVPAEDTPDPCWGSGQGQGGYGPDTYMPAQDGCGPDIYSSPVAELSRTGPPTSEVRTSCDRVDSPATANPPVIDLATVSPANSVAGKRKRESKRLEVHHPVKSVADLMLGQIFLMKATATERSRPVKVLAVNVENDLMEVQLFNSRTKKRQAWKLTHWSPTKISGLRPVESTEEWSQYDLPIDFEVSEASALEPWSETISFDEIIPFPIEAKASRTGALRLPKFFRSFASGF